MGLRAELVGSGAEIDSTKENQRHTPPVALVPRRDNNTSFQLYRYSLPQIVLTKRHRAIALNWMDNEITVKQHCRTTVPPTFDGISNGVVQNALSPRQLLDHRMMMQK